MSTLFCCLVLAIPMYSQQDTVSASPGNASSQEAKIAKLPTEPGSVESTYEIFDLEKKPEFPGGESGMVQFLAENMKYPPQARENYIQGTVVVSFIIDQNGQVTNPVVMKDIGGGCGKEAIRVVNSMPVWKPGQVNGKPVSVKYTLPLRFKLTNSDKPGGADYANGVIPPLYNELQTWDLVRTAAAKTNVSGAAQPDTPFSDSGKQDQLFLKTLEIVFAVKMSDIDRKKLKNLREVAEYFYRSQFGPEFHSGTHFTGKFARMLTNRPDYDLQTEGLGVTGSVKVPKGVKVIMYSQKKFKGKKLEIDASAGPVEIPDLSAAFADIPAVRNEDPTINWMYLIQSIQIFPPANFPPKL